MENSFLSRKISIQTIVRKGTPNFKILGLTLAKSMELTTKFYTIFSSNSLNLPIESIQINITPSGIKHYPNYLDFSLIMSLIFSLYVEHFKDHPLFHPYRIEEILFLGELNLIGEIEFNEEITKFIFHAKRNLFKTLVLPEKIKDQTLWDKDIQYIFVNSINDIFKESLTPEQGKKVIKDTKKDRILKLPDFLIDKLPYAIAGNHTIFLTGSQLPELDMVYQFIHLILPERNEKEVLENLLFGFMDDRPFIKLEPFINKQEFLSEEFYSLKYNYAKFQNGLFVIEEVNQFHKSILMLLQHLFTNPSLIFWFVAYDHPCLCGNLYNKHQKCRCNSKQIQKHFAKYNQFLKKIIEVSLILDQDFNYIIVNNRELKFIREKIASVFEIQKERFKNEDFSFNSRIPDEKIEFYCEFDSQETKQLFEDKIENKEKKFIQRIARTIADYQNHPRIKKEDILFALQFRQHRDIYSIPGIQPFFSDPLK